MITWFTLVFVTFVYSVPLLAQERTEITTPSRPKYMTRDHHALVVGVSNYISWPVLPNAVEDAEEVAMLLKRGGFQVTLLTDPSALELKGALNDLAFITGREPDRSVLFYYSGQGETQILSDGKMLGWIIPKDCPLLRMDPQGFEKKAISTRALESYAKQIRSRHVLMLFDSSFSGDEFKQESPSLKLMSRKRTQPIRQVIVAGRADEPIPDRSLFKYFLIEGLQGDADAIQDGFITGSELGVYLSQWVTRSTKGSQHPQYAKLGDTATRGDFILEKVKRIPKPKKGKLFIHSEPKDARIRILNIQPKFKQGIQLKPGKYHVEVSAQGYKTTKQWVPLKAGEEKKFTCRLKKDEGSYTNFLGMRFVAIKPGSFTMGSPKEMTVKGNDETPHQVRHTRPFFMQTTEITVGQFKKFVEATDYKTEAETAGVCWVGTRQGRWKRKKGASWRNPYLGDDVEITNSYPAACLTWNDAMAFVGWLEKMDGKRYALPTEAQWEYACRAGSKTQFAFGSCLSTDQANYGNVGTQFSKCQDRFKKQRSGPLSVASLKPNAWGVYDMHGNVAEWCRDWYGPYVADAVKDPKGPAAGTERVIRGGNYFSGMDTCRSAKRLSFRAGFAANAIGFRVVMEP